MPCGLHTQPPIWGPGLSCCMSWVRAKIRLQRGPRSLLTGQNNQTKSSHTHTCMYTIPADKNVRIWENSIPQSDCPQRRLTLRRGVLEPLVWCRVGYSWQTRVSEAHSPATGSGESTPGCREEQPLLSSYMTALVFLRAMSSLKSSFGLLLFATFVSYWTTSLVWTVPKLTYFFLWSV